MEQPLDNLDNLDTKTAKVVKGSLRLTLLALAVLVLITGTTPGIAGAQQLQEPQDRQEEQEEPRESSHGGPHSANVQSSWDLVDESGNLHYEIDSAYAESFEAAAASWNELGAVNIEPSPSESETDLVVTDDYLGGPMANTRSDGLITFDPGSMDSATSNAQQTAAAHELGHALGFGHVEGESVMTTPIITNSSSNYSEPTSYDRQEYRERWGSAPEDDSQSDDQPQSDGGGDTASEDPFSTGEGQSPESGQESQYNDQTVEQPDSAKEGDGGANSPEQGWTPEQCFPFCEEGPPSGDSSNGDDGNDSGSDSEDEGSDPSDTGPTTPGAGDGEDGSSQGYTHTGSNEGSSTGNSTGNSTNSFTNRSTNDHTMTNEQACETIRNVQKATQNDSSGGEGEDGITIVLEQRVECDQSSSDSSSESSSDEGEEDTSDTGADETADQQTTRANKEAQEQVEEANKEAQKQIEEANKSAEEQMEKAEQSMEEQMFSGDEMSGELFGD